MTATLHGVPLALSALEYRLLAYLALHRARVVPPTKLIGHLYGDDDAREANALRGAGGAAPAQARARGPRHPPRLRLLPRGRGVRPCPGGTVPPTSNC